MPAATVAAVLREGRSRRKRGNGNSKQNSGETLQKQGRTAHGAPRKAVEGNLNVHQFYNIGRCSRRPGCSRGAGA